MPGEHPKELDSLREDALREIDVYLSDDLGALRLSSDALPRREKSEFDVGWAVSLDVPGCPVTECLVLLDRRFPYAPPRVALVEQPHPLIWPHVEKDGLLCLHRQEQEIPREKPVQVLEWVLRKARELIVENRRETSTAAFRNEFTSYWSIAAGSEGGATAFVSLVAPKGPSRIVVVWRSSSGGVVAEDSTTLSTWLERWRVPEFGGDRPEIRTRKAALLWLPEPLIPEQYPQTGRDVRSLAERLSGDAASLLRDLVVSQPDEIPVLLSMPGTSGVSLGLVRVEHPKRSRRLGRSGDPVTAGFRKGRVPKHVVYDRYFSSGAKANKSVVDRADHTWVHGRDQDPNQEALRSKRVAVVGCGSLGGPVAEHLARVGVGNLLLIDPDHVRWPNVSRHVLGAQAVSQNKADALAKRIRSEFPHLGEISVPGGELNCTATALIAELSQCDLVLEATANWTVSNFVNDLRTDSLNSVVVIYAWMEAAALATHALTIHDSSACLRCGFSEDGRAVLSVTEWPNGPRIAVEPGCGATFTPYGAVELTWGHALVLGVVVDALIGSRPVDNHSIWIGPRQRFESVGATVSEDWRRLVGDPGTGGIRVSRRWPHAEGCSICVRRERAGTP